MTNNIDKNPAKFEPLVWHTEKRKVNDLIPWDENPRDLPEKEEEDLTTSVTKYNLVEIPAINLDRKIAAGHQRVKILKKMGRGNELIDVRVPNRMLTDEEFREYNLRSNLNTGVWDFDKLKPFDIDLLLNVGFDNSELGAIWDDTLGVENDPFDEEKELEAAVKTDIKPGDLFQLGPHRIICGDSQNPATIAALMGKEKTRMLYTDPVYNLSIPYGKGVGGTRNYGGDAVNDSRSYEDYQKFLTTCIKNVMPFCQPDCHYFVWSDEIYSGLVQQIYRELGIENKRTCIWVKDNQNPTVQVAFNKVTEFCNYGVTGKPYLNDSVKNLNEILNKEVGTGNRLHDDILDLLNIWLVKRLPASEYTHATAKPPVLHEKALRRCSKPGDIVLDIFSGSSSIMVSCDQLKRRAFMCDITAAFVQLTLNRYAKFSGNEPIKLN